jgi:hypothetical protein
MAKSKRCKPAAAEGSLIAKWDVGDRVRRELSGRFDADRRAIIEAGRASAAEVPNIIGHFQKMNLAAMQGATDVVSEAELRALARELDDLRNWCRGFG